MKNALIVAFIICAALGLGFEVIDPATARAQMPPAEIVAISEITVNVTDAPSGHNEIEVHIYEQGTGLFLGCSGEQSGMALVNQPNVLYRIAAFFQRPTGEALTFDEIKDKRIYLAVIENDEGPCPAAVVPADDLAGESAAFAASLLETPQVLSFGLVPHLRIAKVKSGEPFPFPPSNIVYITEIRADETDGLSPSNEIEVHIYEYGTERFLGCSGDHSGLNYVDEPGILYRVRACFQKPDNHEEALTYEDIQNRMIYLKVIEDDDNACPAQDSIPPDDLVGTSPPFPGSSLFPPRTMQFGDVKHLTLGVVLPQPVNVTEEPRTIHRFQLSQNYPNPFNPITTIDFSLPEPSQVVLKIFNLSGQEAATVVSGKFAAGTFTTQWDASGFPSGTYYYRLETVDPRTSSGRRLVQTKKLMVIK